MMRWQLGRVKLHMHCVVCVSSVCVCVLSPSYVAVHATMAFEGRWRQRRGTDCSDCHQHAGGRGAQVSTTCARCRRPCANTERLTAVQPAPSTTACLLCSGMRDHHACQAKLAVRRVEVQLVLVFVNTGCVAADVPAPSKCDVRAFQAKATCTRCLTPARCADHSQS